VKVRLLTCDDHPLARLTYRMLFQDEPHIELVGEAENGEQAVRLVAQERPDVVLMDIRMPGISGIEATRQIVHSTPGGATTRVLVLTTYEQDDYVFEALRVGASGFLLKDATPEELVHAVKVVADGEALLAPSITRRLLEAVVPRLTGGSQARERLAQLTRREQEVLRLVGKGLSNQEIAAALTIGHGTARTYLSRLLAKLAARDRVQLVIIAYDAGLVHPEH